MIFQTRTRRERDALRRERDGLAARAESAEQALETARAEIDALESAAARQRHVDPLTGLANHRATVAHLQSMADRAAATDIRGAIILLDIDGFKSVNDREGHIEGDHLLGVIGRRLDLAAREHHVARLGGDEFAVLVDRAENVDDLTVLARELLAVVTKPVTGDSGRTYTLTAGAGIALVDVDSDPLQSIADVDAAARYAKSAGRDRVKVYDARMAAGVGERADVTLTIRQALSEGQFRLELQPIIDVATRRPVGAEALIRWTHPERGELSPADFIPVAERSDVIVDLDRWVLEQAVSILRDWRIDTRTAPLRLAVNISGRHIVEGRLAELIDTMCRRARVDPNSLDVEITETHLVADIARAGHTVGDLRDRGVGVAIDDFGTGYSSMTYLHQLRVDTLKIDRTFIGRMQDEPLDRTIVELLLRLGESLHLRVVAEGVETEAALAALATMGCHWAQGYHIARPMAVADATDWLRAQAG